MKRIALACLAACLPAAALAADLPPLPRKAAVLSNTYPTGSGLYFGIGAGGAATPVEASGLPGVNTAGLNTFGGSVFGTLGYVWGSADGSRFFRVNLDAGWQNINGQSSGISFSGPASIQAGAEIGVPFSQIAAFIPNLGLPNFPGVPAAPTGVTYGTPHMYGGAFVDIQDVSVNFGLAKNEEWKFAPGIRLGMLVPTSNGLMLDTKLEYIWNDSSTCIGPALCTSMGNTVRAKFAVEF
jgi:hypothetical protein